MSDELKFYVSELRTVSRFILRLADVGSDRLSTNQAAFFMLAAAADASGKPTTRQEIVDAVGDRIGKSIRNSYRQLLQPSRVYPKALGWLRTEENPMDLRENVLRLTDKGRSVVERALEL